MIWLFIPFLYTIVTFACQRVTFLLDILFPTINLSSLLFSFLC